MQFAIIGLGVFGQTCANELQQLGNQVLAIDIDEKLVDDISEHVTRAVIADATDKDTIEELDLASFDGVLVRKDGLFVLDELKGLNPENLK